MDTGQFSTRTATERCDCLAWSVVVDITDRKQAEEALKQSETLNRTILNALPDLIIRMHRDGTYLDFKPTAAFPIAFPNLRRGANIRNILPLEAAEQRLAASTRALQSGEIQVYEFLRFGLKDSTSGKKPGLCRSTPMKC